MGLKHIRINLMMVLVVLVAVFTVGVFFAMTTWSRYGTTLELRQHIEKNRLLQNLVVSVAGEIACTSKMNSNIGELAKECQNSRNRTDIALEEITAYDDTTPWPQRIKSFFYPTASKRASISIFEEKNLRRELQKIRDSLDNASEITIEQLIDGEYQHRFIAPIQTYWSNAELYGDAGDKSYLGLYNLLTRAHVDTISDTIFGAYFLTNKRGFSSENFSLWDKYATLASLPELKKVQNITMVKESLFNLFGSKEAQTVVDGVDNMRIDMLLSRESKNSETTIDGWMATSKKKMELYEKAEESTLGYLEEQANTKIEESESVFMAAIPATVMSFVLFLFTLKLYFERRRREHEALRFVMDDLESLTKESRREMGSSEEILRDLSDKEQIYRYIGSIITLLRQKEIQAEEASNAKDLFLANMSHEIRTPLNGIVGFTQLLRETALAKDQQEFVTIIENSSENLLAIVSDILDLSKINAQKMELEHIAFDIFEKVESSVETFAAKADEKEIALCAYTDPALPRHLLGDPTKLAQVLNNLISNAIKFTPDKGTITLSMTRESEDGERCRIRFGVKDSGIGISREQKEKIFQAFTQADSSTSREFGGTGLGLTISSAIVHSMGGMLEVESEVGNGAEFYFTLDLEKDRNHKASPKRSYRPFKAGIVAADSRNITHAERALHEYISHEGIDVTLYGVETIVNLRSASDLPELLIIDHSDFRDAAMLNALVKLDIKVVLMTTGSLKKELDAALQERISVIYKPVTRSKTLRILEGFVEGAVTQSAPRSDKPAANRFGDMRALVAEDNTINQKLIKVTLENFGMHVTITSNGKEAYEARQNGEYDIIFMDIQMPVMNGLEATEAIMAYEEREGLVHIPIIALTANALKGDREKYLRAGMDGYASKPLNLLELQAIIAELSLKKDENGNRKEQPAKSSHTERETHMFIPQGVHSEQKKVKDPHETKGDGEHKKPKKKKKHKNKHGKKILLFNEGTLHSNVYRSIFSGLGFDVDVVHDGHDFLDRLEHSSYAYAAYDCSCFEEPPCLIADVVRGADAIPLVFVNEQQMNDEYCTQTVERRCDVETIRKKMEEAW